MRHYINKQSPKKINDDEVVFPPDVNIDKYKEDGIAVRNYNECKSYDYGNGIGGAISQEGGFIKQTSVDAYNEGYIEECSYMSRTADLIPHNMSGRFDLISVPNNVTKPAVVMSMFNLIDKYIGKFVCLDLWNTESIRVEKCGILEAAEDGYILIRGTEEEGLTMIDLSSVKYINIYCR